MKHGKRFLTIVFALLMVAGAFAVSASAQTGGRYMGRRIVVQRPVIVRRYIVRDPFWRTRYWNPYWGYSSSFYDPYWSSPYLRHLEQRYYLERQLAGNRRELQEHLRKYRADGVITPKEQRELEDDYKDVRESIEKLNRFNRAY